jgi:hypothetical protein
MPTNPPGGKYSDVLQRYGKAGFGVPAKAPNVGSFPLYPLTRARFALAILASPQYDSKQSLRNKVAKRAIAAHPRLAREWAQAMQNTILPRMAGTRALSLVANPLGRTMGRKVDIVRFPRSETTHVLDSGSNKPLCMKTRAKVGAFGMSSGNQVNCLRCLKILGMESGVSFIERDMTPSAPRKRKKHLMVPGGRAGRRIADNDRSPFGVKGQPEFPRGPYQHPTQAWMSKTPSGDRGAYGRVQSKVAKPKAVRLAANPNGRRVPLRYGSVPAQGHAEKALIDKGYQDWTYRRKGTVPGLGPVLA